VLPLDFIFFPKKNLHLAFSFANLCSSYPMRTAVDKIPTAES